MLKKIKRLLIMQGFNFSKDIKITRKKHNYEIIKENKVIKISLRHSVYLLDIADNFDIYFSSVESHHEDNKNVVDYAMSIPQNVRGYNLHPIIFPSFPEPIETIKQYTDFAQLDSSSIVVDLGAYSGLTSIFFDREISNDSLNAKGKVIAVEADFINLSCFIRNIEAYKSKTNRNIEYVYSAISNKDGYECFFSDGSMGSNSNVNVIFRQGYKMNIPSITLSSLAKRFSLDKIDFIKCDVEGAEKYIFEDEEFFEKYSPRILVEAHRVNNSLTVSDVVESLNKYGYKCETKQQIGFEFPLIECIKK